MSDVSFERVRNLLAVIVDSVDYIGSDAYNRSCSPTEMVGAVLPRELLLEAKQLLQETRTLRAAQGKES